MMSEHKAAQRFDYTRLYASAGHDVPGAVAIPVSIVPSKFDEVFARLCNLIETRAAVWLVTQQPCFGRIDMREALVRATACHGIEDFPSDPALQPNAAACWLKGLSDLMFQIFDRHRNAPEWKQRPDFLSSILAAGS
jgi:hypothetical protein